MSENKGAIAPTVIKSVTALLCSAAIAFTGSSITTKVCDNRKELAEKAAASAPASVADAAEDVIANVDSAVSDAVSDVAAADDTAADDTAAADDTSTDAAAADTSAADSTAADSKATAKEITLTSGLQSTNKAEVLKYYKLVAAKNAKGTYKTVMKMTSLDGGKGGVGALISAFEPIAKKALEKNSTTGENIPSAYDKILESDWEKATATNDGTYTTIKVQLKNQTDGAYGKSAEGTVGRTIAVLHGVATALAELDGVSADFDNAKFSLVYDQAYMQVKVKNSTGEFVKGACTWHYRVNVNLDLLTVKVAFISATLNGGKGTIDYSVTF